MIRFHSDDIRIILEALKEKYGPGYSKIKEVGALQAMLSIHLEVALKMEEAGG